MSVSSKLGFVYIWYDRKHKRYYIGSHWGAPDDGYVCSSKWMKKSYRRRPRDFRRRILVSVIISKEELLEAEQKWLNLVRSEELGKRYYNLTKNVVPHHKFRSTVESRKKLSDARKGMKFTQEHCANIGKSKKGKDSWMKGRQHTDETKQKMKNAGQGKNPSTETLEKRSKSLKGMKWYTDGVQDCRLHEGDPIPDGFVRGRSKGLDNLTMLAEKWNDPAYREHMSLVHKKPIQQSESS